MRRVKTFGLHVTGQKGRVVLEGLQVKPEYVETYQDKGTDESDYTSIVDFCAVNGIPVFSRKDKAPRPDAELLFFVGWQFLISDNLEKSIVLHDSYLPTMKGFAPTATSLILGLPLGATAFRPTIGEIDSGPIYLRRRIEVKHPMALYEANMVVAANYISMIDEILKDDPDPVEIDEPETFSVWRGPEDMMVDWDKSAKSIQRMVLALGRPLSGAKTRYAGNNIVLKSVEVAPEMNFVERHPGKVWKIDGGCPKVICGSGMLIIREAVDRYGEPVEFKRLRERMGI